MEAVVGAGASAHEGACLLEEGGAAPRCFTIGYEGGDRLDARRGAAVSGREGKARLLVA